MPKISVVINTYNAREHLDEVLRSVEGFDEVLVCDMESTDDTLDIARRHGCRIVTFPKANHVCAEPARTFAIQSAAHPWVLVVDADELVTPELREYLYRRCADPHCPALYIPRLNKFLGRYTKSTAYDHQLRFFPREGTQWPPYVHTFPTVAVPTERIPPTCKNVRLIHLAEETVADRIEKTNRYTDGELLKRPDRRYGPWALFWRPLWRFMRSYFIKMGLRDGRAGLLRAGLDALYQFVLVAKNMERQEAQSKKQ